MVTVVACPAPVFQFFDNSGKPAIGGSLLTQVAGVNYPTYQDSAGTIPLPNPIPLNSRGEVSNASGQTCQLFVIPNTVYAFTLSDENGNLLWNEPYVNGISVTQTQAQIGQLLWPQTASELAAGVTPTYYYYPPYNVLRYGADPNGISSSLAAFNAAYASAMETIPHDSIYAPTGTYLIPAPGLNWTNQNSIYLHGDGAGLSVLNGDGSNAYTILTLSADTGSGTTGTDVELRDFSIKSGAAGQPALLIADYLGVLVESLLLFSSGNALTLNGCANLYGAHLNCLTGWVISASGSSALLLSTDTNSIGCGPLTFNSCEFNGQGNALTAGAAVSSKRTICGVFQGCAFYASGTGLTSVVELTDADDVTCIECYSEDSQNTANNNAVLFNLSGTVSQVQQFAIIGGTYFNGNGTFSANYLVNGVMFNKLKIDGVTAAGFATAMLNWTVGNLTGLSMIDVANAYSSGSGSPPVFNTGLGAPSGIVVAAWQYPPLSTGWGTPTGGAVESDYTASPTQTMAATSAALAQIIKDLTTRGILGS
jgi:hypothetical protein